MVRRGLVLGCGGTVGGAWQMGALHALEHALGWDPRTADVIVGTSAGGTAAVMLGSGVGTAEMVAAQRDEPTARPSVRTFCCTPPAPLPAIPFGVPPLRLTVGGLRHGAVHTVLAGLAPTGRTRTDFLDDLVADLAPGGWVSHPATWLVATGVGTGDRVALGRASASPCTVRDAVRATWAIPGWYPPVEIGTDRYVDGGARSTASADMMLGTGVDEVVVVAPMAGVGAESAGGVGGRLERLLRGPMSRRLDAEIRTLEATGIRVLRVHPTAAELAVMGPNFMDPGRRRAALETAIKHVPERISV